MTFGRTHWGKRYDGEYIIGPFAGVFPSNEPPSYWRSMADQSRNVRVPSWACNNLPAWVQRVIGRNCTFGAIYDSVSKKALKDWRKSTPAEKEAQAKEAEKTVHNLVSIENRLNEMRGIFKVVGKAYDKVTVSPSGRREVDRSAWPTWANQAQIEFNNLNVAYKIMATQVYANSFELDKRTGKAVLPGAAVDAQAGLGFGLYEYDPNLIGTPLDGEMLGSSIAANIEAETFGLDPVFTPTVVITGLVVLGVLGVSFAVAWGAASEALKRRSDNALSKMQIESQREIAASPSLSPALKQQLLKNLDAQQERSSEQKKKEAEKPGVGAEITKALIPVVIGISALGLVFNVLEKRLTGGR